MEKLEVDTTAVMISKKAMKELVDSLPNGLEHREDQVLSGVGAIRHGGRDQRG